MIDGTQLLGFIIASLVILLIPGPGVVCVITQSISQGRRAGYLSVLGLSVGAVVHVAAATVGLSAVFVTSHIAFAIVKTLGAAYLIYLGIRVFLGRRQDHGAANTTAHRSPNRLFKDGVMISILNPKIAVFFLAFLPQFVNSSHGYVTQQILLLGIVYVVLALCTDSTYAFLSGGLRNRIGGRFMLGKLPRYASGLVYIVLGVAMALTGRRS